MPNPFPPPDFAPVESAVPGIEVYAPAPPEPKEHREVVEFNCPRCGAHTAYSASDGGLTCTHCDYYEPPRQPVVGKGAEQFEFTVDALTRAAHGWGAARKELQCQNCGAYTSVPPDSLTHVCPFCASNKVIQRESPQDLLRPRFVIPFKIEADACHQIARDWLGSSWMTPGPLRNLARLAEFTGIYLPFWTFDSTTQASWRAEVGHTKTERYYSGGKWRSRTKTVWRWESGQVQEHFDDLLVSGSTRLSTILLNRIKTYDLRALAAYEPKYLAGFQAQAYDTPLEAAWETARQEMRQETRRACERQASSSKMRNFSMELRFADEEWRYILLPVYLAAYTYQDNSYQVMVNGQTGAIAGQRPVAWFKVWLAVVALLAPGVTVGVVGAATLLLGGLGFPIAVVGFILLTIGLIISFKIIQQAQQMDEA